MYDWHYLILNMENKIVLELIKKDIEELKVLVDNLEKAENQNELLIEISKAKASTLLKEFELLTYTRISNIEKNVDQIQNDKEHNTPKQIKEVAIPRISIVEEPIVEDAPVREIQSKETSKPTIDEAIEESVQVEFDVRENIQQEQAKVETIEIPIIQNTVEEPQAETVQETVDEQQVIDEPNEENDDLQLEEEEKLIVGKVIEEEKILKTEEHRKERNEVLAAELPDSETTVDQTITKRIQVSLDEEKEVTPNEELPDNEVKHSNENDSPKILGEQFKKEPSLNDRHSNNTVASKIKGKPITSLKSAIGLNDRFLFTRELFENVSSKFTTTVETLDNCTTLVEAIEYLEENYTWTKNETSLKFMDLIKRRFEN